MKEIDEEKITEEDGRDDEKNKDIKEQVLEKTAIEYFESAKEQFNKSRYNSAVVLFFKSLVALIDLFILQKTGKTPSSHTERFRLTEENFADVYDILDKDFPFYQDSYNILMTKELAGVIREDAEYMAKKTSIKL